MPLVEGDLSNRFCSRDLSFVGWKNKAVETLIAQARIAAVRCASVYCCPYITMVAGSRLPSLNQSGMQFMSSFLFCLPIY